MQLRTQLVALARDVLKLSPASEDQLLPWATQIAAAIGPLAAPEASSEGELDGFVGIHHRGGFHHLLASEWALAKRLPLEFLRRATQGELSYHRLARRQPQQGRASVLLLNAGLEQLGSPRIVQLAVLLALYLRAERAGAEFHWGILHRPGIRYRGLQTRDIRSFLAARTFKQFAATDLDLWRTHIAEELAEAEDLWLADAESRQDAGRPAFQNLRVCSRPLDPDHLDLEISGHRRSRTTLSLRLPDAPQRVQLLRDPFAHGDGKKQRRPILKAGVPRIHPASPLVFSASGHRLCCLAEDGRLLGIHVPHSNNDDTGRTRGLLLPEGHHPLAVGFRGRLMLVLSRRDDRLFLHRGQGTNFQELSWRGPEVELGLGRDELGPLHVSQNTYFIQREGGGLLQIERGIVEALPNCVAHDIRYPGCFLQRCSVGYQFAEQGRTIPAVPNAFVWFGPAFALASGSPPEEVDGHPCAGGLLAARTDDDEISVFVPRRTHVCFKANLPDDHYIGAAWGDSEPCLLSVSRTREHICIEEGGHVKQIRLSSSQIRTASYHAHSGRVAMATRANELWVYDLRTRQVLRQIQDER